jgi:hypothetical protein
MSNITGGELSLSLTTCEVAHCIENYLSATLSYECEPISIQLVKGPGLVLNGWTFWQMSAESNRQVWVLRKGYPE